MPTNQRLLLAVAVVIACRPPAAAGASTGNYKPRTDPYGDALPDGAIARCGTIRLKHSNDICGLAYSSDGMMLVSTSQGWVTRLWDANTGRLLGQYNQHLLAVTPDLKTLALLSQSGQLTLLDVSTAKERHLLDVANDKPFESYAFTTDGKTFITATPLEKEEGVLLTHWDVKTGTKRSTVRMTCAMGPRVLLAASSRDSAKVVLYAMNGNVVTSWSAETGKLLLEFRGHTGDVWTVSRSADGETLASAAAGEECIWLWDTKTGKHLRTLPCNLQDEMVISFDGKNLATGPAFGDSSIRDIATGKVLMKIDGSCAAFSPDGKRIATGGRYSVHIWDASTGKEILKWPGHRGAINSVAFAPDGKSLASGGADGAVFLWPNLDGTKPQLLTNDLKDVINVVFAAGHPMLAASGVSGVSLWDTATGKLVRKRDDRSPKLPTIGRAAFFPDGKSLLVGWHWQLMWVWSVETDNVKHCYEGIVRYLPGRGWLINNAVLSPDGNTLLEFDDHEGIGRDALTGRIGFKVDLHQDIIRQRVRLFAADSKTLVAVGHTWPALGESYLDGVLFVDIATSKVRSNTNLGKNFPICATISPDGQSLAVGNANGSVTLVEVASAGVCLHFGGHLGAVNEIAFAPDGKLMATASEDGTILLWDLVSLSMPKGGPPVLSDKRLATLWADLASNDAAVAYRASILFRQDPQKSSAFLLQQLDALWKHDPKQVRQLIANLDDNSYAVRQKALAELLLLEDIAGPAIHEALNNSPTLELRSRLVILVAKLNPPTPSPRQLTVLRSLAILEAASTPQGCAWLTQMAAAPETWLGREARLALDRIKKRTDNGARTRELPELSWKLGWPFFLGLHGGKN